MNGARRQFSCQICGTFEITGSALAELTNMHDLDPLQRAAISHRLRAADDSGTIPQLTTAWLEVVRKDPPALPSPPLQAINIVRWVGDQVVKTGKRVRNFPLHFFAAVGSPTPRFALDLANELVASGILIAVGSTAANAPANLEKATLTLEGWRQYEEERRGHLSGDFGFIAMKFNDSVLDPFVLNVVKPAVEQLGYRLVDMRDVARPGIIDNIMRQTVRDAAFVLVDLTHDNAGAYWEAGYAEGLGKPVLYLCEQSKFDARKTHFDTNHCTTVTWAGEKTDAQFVAELGATLRNELRLFPIGG